jgi:membrane protein
MTSNTQELSGDRKLKRTRHMGQTIAKRLHLLHLFWIKFNNDWSWNNAAGLAYNLLLSMFPLVIAFLALLDLALGKLDASGYSHLVQQLTTIFPDVTSSESIINPALRQLARDSGILGVVAIMLSIFNGSRLFLFLEGCFDIIYQVRPRGVILQNVVAIAMVLVFVVLIPIMVLASSLPALAVTMLQHTPLGHLPDSGLLLSLSGMVGGLIVAYLLFQTIYLVVPHRRISFRKSWPGAVVAAVLLELYLVLFPLYVTYFLGSFARAVGLLILLLFFYYFALIIFLGAEVNAFLAAGIHTMPYDLATMVHVVTSHLATDANDLKGQVATDHREEEAKAISPQSERPSGLEEETKGAA